MFSVEGKNSAMSRKLLGLLGGIGAGKVREPDEPENFPPHFEFLEHFLSAEKEYYFDQEVYGLGAKGGVLIFGVESAGGVFGFDAGDDYQIVVIDNYRIVKKLFLSFEAFAVGVFACYPDFPTEYSSGKWRTANGGRIHVVLMV